MNYFSESRPDSLRSLLFLSGGMETRLAQRGWPVRFALLGLEKKLKLKRSCSHNFYVNFDPLKSTTNLVHLTEGWLSTENFKSF